MSAVARQKILVIGLGSMGLGMASSLARSGHDVTGLDLSPEARGRFAAAGGRAVATLAPPDRFDVAVCVVVNAVQSQAVLFGADGAAGHLNPQGVIISCATMAPEAARNLAARAEAAGLHFVDAPLSGGAARAADGGLTVMASARPDALRLARPVLDAMAAKVYDLGDAPGIGAAFKIVNQLLAGVHIAAACEAITFARAMGLDLAKVYEVITASAGNSWMFENRIPHVLEGDYAPRSAVSIFTKDLGIVADIGRDLKFPTPVASMALQMFVMTAAAGMAADDDASVARMLAGLAGIDLPRQPD